MASTPHIRGVRIAGCCGVVACAIALAEFPLWFVSGSMPQFWDATAFSNFATQHSTLYLTRTLMDLFIFSLLVVFFAGFRHLVIITNADYEWLATTFFGLAMVYTALTLVSDSLTGSIALDTFGGKADPTVHETSSQPIKRSNLMGTNGYVMKKIDVKVLLSTLWIVVMINMLMADILSLFIPGAAEEVAKTAASTGTPIPQLMLGGAIMMELALVMIVLSRLLKYRVNRWANLLVSLITIAFVVGGGVAYPHYIFIATVEVICLLLILWNAWHWRAVEA